MKKDPLAAGSLPSRCANSRHVNHLLTDAFGLVVGRPSRGMPGTVDTANCSSSWCLGAGYPELESVSYDSTVWDCPMGLWTMGPSVPSPQDTSTPFL